jgi:hypothetical protein
MRQAKSRKKQKKAEKKQKNTQTPEETIHFC